MTLPPDRKLPVIPLLGRNTRHSFVPAKICTAVARSGRSRAAVRLARQRFTLGGRKHDGSLAIFRDDAVHSDVLAASLLLNGAAYAGRASPVTHRANGISIHPLAAFVTEASRRFDVPEHWIRVVMHVESGARQRVRSSKGRGATAASSRAGHAATHRQPDAQADCGGLR